MYLCACVYLYLCFLCVSMIEFYYICSMLRVIRQKMFQNNHRSEWNTATLIDERRAWRQNLKSWNYCRKNDVQIEPHSYCWSKQYYCIKKQSCSQMSSNLYNDIALCIHRNIYINFEINFRIIFVENLWLVFINEFIIVLMTIPYYNGLRYWNVIIDARY